MQFPKIAPRTVHPHQAGFTVLASNDVPVQHPTYVVCMFAQHELEVGEHEGCPGCPNCVPPKALGVYVYPVQFLHVERRQYWLPQGLLIPADFAQVPSHTEKTYRKLKWRAQPPRTEVFAVALLPNGESLLFEQGWNTAITRWSQLTIDRWLMPDVEAALRSEIERMRSSFFSLSEHAPPDIAERYRLAEPHVEMVYMTNLVSQSE